MADCEKLHKCPFFGDRMANMPTVAELMKQTYCRGDSSQCARFKVATAGLEVPLDLYPNDLERAMRLLHRA